MRKYSGRQIWRISLLALFALLLIFVLFSYMSVSSSDPSLPTSEVSGMLELDSSNLRVRDSISVVTSRFYQGDDLKRLMQGEQYRDAWSTPIKVPIVWLDTLLGGMTVIEEGGGMQTHSLKLTSSNGTLYTLRSINKDPSPLIPKFAYKLGLENVITDGISAQHPYASLVVAQLASSANILHTNPRAMYIPEQATLGKLNKKYGNRLFMFEYETEGDVNWTQFEDVIAITETDGLQKLKLKHGNKLQIDKGATIRARLFDLLIGDWDRHAKQWGWVIRKDGHDHYLAIPLPGDRDNAFFSIDGIIPTIISSETLTPGLQSFKEDVEDLPGIIMDFDLYFLKNVSERIWIAEAQRLQEMLTNQVIDQALRVWPPSLYNLHAEQIRTNIIARRADLIHYAKRFKENVDAMPSLTEPLKGSEELSLDPELLACFDCK